jgi:hypothetical protein
METESSPDNPWNDSCLAHTLIAAYVELWNRSSSEVMPTKVGILSS